MTAPSSDTPSPDPVEQILLQQFQTLVEGEPARQGRPVVVLDEPTGAVTEALRSEGRLVRTVQDSRRQADRFQRALDVEVHPVVDHEVLQDAGVVVLQLARPLEALEEAAWLVSRFAADDVVLLAGGREKHLNRSMNTELERHFDSVRASRGARKSRVLIGADPLHSAAERTAPPRIPRRHRDHLLGAPLDLRAYGLTFGAARVDPGTRFLLETMLDPNSRTSRWEPDQGGTVVDLGCGNGTVSVVLAQHTRHARIIASDDSASAVRSTQATLAANEVSAERVEVHHADGLEHLADSSVQMVVLNPPFHQGAALTADIAHHLFAESARTLVPGGRLWCVWNSHLKYRSALERVVGPTQQIDRNATFTVTLTEAA